MKKTILLLFASILMIGFGKAQNVYFTNDSTQATLKVAMVTDTTQADLLVFEVGTVSQVNKHGQFFKCSNIDDAELIIYIVDDPKKAQIIIAYVDNAIITGWRHPEKVRYFKSK